MVITPQIIPGLIDVRDIVTSGAFSFAILKDNTVKVWGDNYYCQLGMCGEEYIATPTVNPNLTNIRSIIVNNLSNYINALAITNDGDVLIFEDYKEPKSFGLSDIETGIITYSGIILTNKNKELYVYGQNDNYNLCPGLIKNDGTFENHFNLDIYIKYIDELPSYSKLIAKLQLKEEHQVYQPLVQCLKNSKSEVELVNCWNTHDPDKNIITILKQYTVSGKPTSDTVSYANSFMGCVDNTSHSFELCKEKCWNKLELIEEHKHFQTMVDCIKNSTNWEGIYMCIESSEYDMMEFENTLFEYDYNGKYFFKDGLKGLCRYIYNTPTKIPYLKNVQINDYHPYYLTLGTINHQLFAWGHLSIQE